MDRLEEIRQRTEAATPGPWKQHNSSDVFTQLGANNGNGAFAAANDAWQVADCDPASGAEWSIDLDADGAIAYGHLKSQANARFIAHAREDMEYLLSGHDHILTEIVKTADCIRQLDFLTCEIGQTGDPVGAMGHTGLPKSRPPFAEQFAELKLIRDVSDNVQSKVRWLISKINRLTVEVDEYHAWRAGKRGVEEYLTLQAEHYSALDQIHALTARAEAAEAERDACKADLQSIVTQSVKDMEKRNWTPPCRYCSKYFVCDYIPEESGCCFEWRGKAGKGGPK